MDIGDTVSALQGFANAYTKLALSKKSDVSHQIRISGIKKGSVEFVLKVLAENKDALEAAAALATVGGSAAAIFLAVLEVIKLTKHIGGAEHTAKPSAETGGVVVENSDNVTVVVSNDVYNIYQEGLIKQDLSRLVAPLKINGVDAVKLSAKTRKGRISEDITSRQKSLFGYTPEESTQTKEMTLVGFIISLNKEWNGGSFRLQDGSRVSYKLKSDHPQTMYEHFVHKGLVRVNCVAHLDESLKPIRIEIRGIEDMEPRML